VDIIYSLLLGALQGITEFLPVSSSAHLILWSSFVNNEPLPIYLNIALHLGTLSAVLIFFWRDWLKIGVACFNYVTKGTKSFESHVLLPAIIVGSIPAGVVGVLWQDSIESIFHHPSTTIFPLAFVGIALWYVDKKCSSQKNIKQLSLLEAFMIGVFQAMALIPGVSRSGITILAGRLYGFTRHDAAKFSFMLGTPAMAGAALLNAKNILTNMGHPEFYLGFVSSMVVGCLTIGLLLKFIVRFGFGVFAVYRILLAIVLLLIL